MQNMNFFLRLFFWFLIFVPFPVLAEQSPNVVVKENFEPNRAATIINNIIETAKYFNQTYPEEKINQDLYDDIAKHFPNLSTQQIYDYQYYLRKGIQFYRYFDSIYKQYVENVILPQDPPLIVNDNEYDLFSPKIDYIDNQQGTVIIQDFKKVISYSGNKRDIDAYNAKFQKDIKKKNDFEQLGYIFSKLELKKLPFYNLFYGSPLTGDLGIGNWENIDNIKIRLITIQTAIDQEQSEIQGLIHLIIPNEYFITAIDSGKYFKPIIDFSLSQNLKNIDYTLPLPTRFRNINEDWTIYVGEVAIPFTASVNDTKEKLNLKANIELNLCQKPDICKIVKLSPELSLNPGKSQNSSVTAYIQMMSNFLIPQEKSELLIKEFYLEKINNDQQMLTLIFDCPEKIKSFTFYMGNTNGLIFQRPKISINEKQATVRILTLNKNPSAQEKSFEITAEANQKFVLRNSFTPKMGHPPAPKHIIVVLSMLLCAVMGGFLLNFMPCIFPVLSLKLLSLTKFGARQPLVAQHNFILTLLGIWSSFLLLASILALLKYGGHIIGWGMQFQNSWFTSIIFFATLIFIAQIWGIVNLKLPQTIPNNNIKNNNLIHFLTGTFTVLMSTPCTAPYLGTAVGFALAGDYLDIFIIFFGIACGLSIPYFILLLFPQLIKIIPSPGPWMLKVNHFMIIMLFLTLGWLIHIIYAQTNFWFIIRLCFYGILFWLLLWIRHICYNLDLSSLPADTTQKDINKFASFFAALAFLVFTIASIDGCYAAKKNINDIKKNHLADINNDEIDKYLNQGKTVLVTIGADWCLTCRYNDIMVLDNPSFIQKIKNHGVVVLNIDWTIRNKDTLKFMKKYGRSGLPFYIVFSPLIPDGLILPEILSEHELNSILDNISVTPLNP